MSSFWDYAADAGEFLVGGGVAAAGVLSADPALTMGGVALAGGGVSNAINQNFSTDQAASARSYNTTMSNSVYQRGAADLKAAGINPVLASQYSDPVPLDPVPSFTSSNPGSDFVSGYSSGASSANSIISAAKTSQDISQSASNFPLIHATLEAQLASAQDDAFLKDAQTTIPALKAETDQIVASDIYTRSQISQVLQATSNALASLPGIKSASSAAGLNLSGAQVLNNYNQALLGLPGFDTPGTHLFNLFQLFGNLIHSQTK